MLASLALLVVAASTAGLALAPVVVARFLRRPAPPEPERWPRVSVIKPVKGVDAAAREGFVSFVEQEYPGEFEVIFAVEGQEDPVLPVIRELQALYPDTAARSIRLVDSSPRLVEMGKANNVLAAQRAATGEVYVSADSDVVAGASDLRRLVSTLLGATPRPGMRVGAAGAIPVYRGMQDLGAGLMGAYYSPFMVIYYSLKDWFGPRDVFPGTYYAILPEALAAVGGWARIADNIADDSTMGAYLHAAGFESVMSRVTGSVPEPTKSLEDLWNHQHRWNLTYRATLPIAVYALEPLAHPFVLALAMPALFGGLGWQVLGAYVLVRWGVVAFVNAVYLREPSMWRWLWLMPVSELVLTGAWLRSLLQPTTSWRGHVYRVQRGGRLVRLK
jgi:ceramide glucosyltransferase